MGSFRVVMADPPWKYDGPAFEKKGVPQGEADKQYPCLELAELVGMKPLIDGWADRSCCLFLWTTAPKLDDAMALGRLWGFRYTTVAFVWVKIKERPDQLLMFPTVEDLFHAAMLSEDLYDGMGYHTSIQTELCLLWKRGNPGAFKIRMADQVVFDVVREHSRKPDKVRRTIELAYPDAPRLEMFAREKLDGWEPWGNEVGKFDRWDAKGA